MRKTLTLALLMTGFFAKAQYHVADPTGDPPSTSHNYYANSGQIIDDTGATRPEILFYTENRTPNLFLAADRVSFAMRTIGNDTASDSTHRIDMQFKCSSWSDNIPCGTIQTYEPSDDFLNYYLPHCSSGIENVPGYAGIVYENAFPNINVHLYSNEDGFKQYFELKPGANPSDFILKFKGQDSIAALDSILLVYINKHQFVLPMVYAYQLDGQDSITPVGWNPQWVLLQNDEVALSLGSYDPTQRLIISVGSPWKATGVPDANMDWATYYGDGGFQRTPVISVQSNKEFYHAMGTVMGTYPLATGSHPSNQSINSGGHDSYMTKFNSNGSRAWSTYYGGTEDDLPQSVLATFPSNHDAYALYLAGYTESNNLNMGVNGTMLKGTYGGNRDGFIANFDASNGRLLKATYYGGNGTDEITSLSADNATGLLYFAGNTDGTSYSPSTNYCGTPPSASQFPLCPGSGTRYFQSTKGGSTDGFLGAFNINSYALEWSTLFGGSGIENLRSIHFSPYNSTIDICGSTTTTTPSATTFPSPIVAPSTIGQFPITNPGGSAYVQHVNSSGQDGFIAQFNSAFKLSWCSFYGGSGGDDITKIITNTSTGELYIAGSTTSSTSSSNMQSANNSGSFPIYHDATSYNQSYGGGNSDAFFGKFSNTNQLTWSTYFGGNGDDVYYSADICGQKVDIAVDADQDVYFSGYSRIYNGNSGDNIPVYAAPGKRNQSANASTSTSDPYTQIDGWIAQFYPNNKEKWITNFGGVYGAGSSSTQSPHEEINAIGVAGTTSNVTLYITGITACDNTPHRDPGSPAYYLGSNQGHIDAFIARFLPVSSLFVNQSLVSPKNSLVTVVPNPSNGEFEISCKSSLPLNKEVSIKVINCLGQVVQTKVISFVNGASKFTVDLRNAPSGVYLLGVDGGNISSARLVKE